MAGHLRRREGHLCVNTSVYNSSHCVDMTPKLAMDAVNGEQRDAALTHRANDLARLIRTASRLAGFEVVGRFTLRDNVTGREFS